jgi:hypothetical protein
LKGGLDVALYCFLHRRSLIKEKILRGRRPRAGEPHLPSATSVCAQILKDTPVTASSIVKKIAILNDTIVKKKGQNLLLSLIAKQEARGGRVKGYRYQETFMHNDRNRNIYVARNIARIAIVKGYRYGFFKG